MHNQLRRRVAKGEEPGQPGAANMRRMVTSDYIAYKLALRWGEAQKKIAYSYLQVT